MLDYLELLEIPVNCNVICVFPPFSVVCSCLLGHSLFYSTIFIPLFYGTPNVRCVHKLILHIPAQLMVGLLDFMECLGITMPIKVGQIRRLTEDKAFSHAEAQEAFGYAPMAFEEGIRQEVAFLRAGRDGLSD